MTRWATIRVGRSQISVLQHWRLGTGGPPRVAHKTDAVVRAVPSFPSSPKLPGFYRFLFTETSLPLCGKGLPQGEIIYISQSSVPAAAIAQVIPQQRGRSCRLQERQDRTDGLDQVKSERGSTVCSHLGCATSDWFVPPQRGATKLEPVLESASANTLRWCPLWSRDVALVSLVEQGLSHVALVSLVEQGLSETYNVSRHLQ